MLFQHSLVNLWVSYMKSGPVDEVYKVVSAFSGESLGELPLGEAWANPIKAGFSILW